jgi:cellulose 1,4-beta-cellobiosidase
VVVHRHPARASSLALVVGAALLMPWWGVQAAQAAPASPAAAAAAHASNPFAGSTPYLNPDYVSEVQTQASADGNSAEAKVGTYQTAIWMDHIGAIAGDGGHLGLKAQLDKAETQAQGSSTPVMVEVVVYDLPGRDCAALASNGEIPATDAGLTQYESQYIDPIVAIEGASGYSNLRIVNFVEPDSLPNAVTNQSKTACAAATPYYEKGIAYALGKLHGIGSQIYNYLDIGHSGWLGWPNNMTGAGPEYAKVVQAASGGYATVDGFVSDTANTTPSDEPFLPNSSLTVGGQPLKSANFYQYNPYFDEHSYDEAMYSEFVSSGFPSSVGMIIDTSRNGWGGPSRPTSLNSSPTDVNSYVTANKVDQRPFRGDWCNVNGAGIGARPQASPYGSGDHIIADVWIKPPGESDGDYPTASHSHGDPHCDPAGTQTDGNGGTYPTDAIPGYDVPAGQWFGFQFQQLVQNAYPSLGGTTGGDTTPPSAPTGVTVASATSSSVSLTWTASTDNVGVTGYDIYRGTTLAGTSATASFTDTGLTASTQYSYTVKAFDAAGNLSSASSAVTATTTSGSTGGDTTPPSTPTNVTASGVTSTGASLSWSPSTDNVGVAGYHVYRGGTLVGSTASTSFSDSGLTPSTHYSYTVVAYDAAGNVSPASAAVSVTTTAGGTGGSGCSATYQIGSDWGSGFTANVTVTNTGTTATKSWKVTWTWSGNQQVTSMWNATNQQSGQSETATSMSYNGAIAAGANTSFGFQGGYSGSNATPTLTCTAS